MPGPFSTPTLVFATFGAALFWPASLRAEAPSAAGRPSLVAALPAENIAQVLVPREAWRPYPTVDDRAFWENLPEAARSELIVQGESRRSDPWPTIPATAFLEFYRSGKKEPYQSLSWGRRQRLGALVLAECAEDQGRFLDAIVDGLWAVCEESFWGNSTNTWVQSSLEDQRRYSSMQLSRIRTSLPDVTKPGVDLWAGETAGVVVWTSYLLGDRLDRVSPLVRPRLQFELERRILAPCRERDFKWMTERGNWNPWICSNWLATLLLAENDPARRAAGLHKILRALDYYLAHFPTDGGCDEGPGYWRRSAAALFDCLELLHSATEGRVNIFRHPIVQEAGRFIYRVHVAGDYYFNFNDSSAKADVPASLAMRFGRRIGDENLVAFGASRDDNDAFDPSYSLLRRLPALHELAKKEARPVAAPPLVRDVWLPVLQVMAARAQAGSTAGFYLAAKGGHNGEGHNHNDVGNFILFADGLPVIVDVGPEAYTAENSGPDRYKIWTMQSAWHNLPTIGDVMQQAGPKYAARNVVYQRDDRQATFAMELAGAYPAGAGLASWQRTLQLERAGTLRVTERFRLQRPVETLTLSLVTPCRIEDAQPGELALHPAGAMSPVRLRFDAAKLRATRETVSLVDQGLRRVWGEQLTRIILTATQPALEDEWTVTFAR